MTSTNRMITSRQVELLQQVSQSRWGVHNVKEEDLKDWIVLVALGFAKPYDNLTIKAGGSLQSTPQTLVAAHLLGVCRPVETAKSILRELLQDDSLYR